MLRNLAITNSDGSGIMGTSLVGVLAADLPTGFTLPGLLNNDVATGDPVGCLYRLEILGQPSAGKLVVDEVGAFSFTGAPDGTYTGSERVSKYHPDTGIISADVTTYSFTVGTPAVTLDTTVPTMTGAITLSAITQAGARAAWQAASDNVSVAGYEISVDTGTPAWTPIGNVLVYDISGKTAGTSYTVRLRAVDAAGNKAAPLTTTLTTASPPPVYGASVTLNNPDGTVAANLANLRWAWFDQPSPDLFTAPADQGTVEATDASGVLQVSLPHSTLTPGGIGWLIVTDSTGNPLLGHSAFSGPLAVS